MRASFDQQLRDLTSRLRGLAELAAKALELSTRALLDGDVAAAEEALDLGENIDTLHAECSERTVAILALQHPVAGDLRFVFSAVRMSSDLARMGQLALHIARAARRRTPGELVPDEVRGDITRMGELTAGMARGLRDALTEPNLELVSLVRTTDAELDAVHARLLETLRDPEWTHGVTPAVDLALVARFYERFGDQAVDVAERVIFLITGRRPDGDPAPPGRP
ncbi:phosphate signaling complex protein PhoU [Rhodococcus sp. 14C212]|uniref:phosphate signaling complex protein PhoU n=1 Tax=Rhodococcus sp. 14C212 TaxID=2711209 RepID=UPI0013ECC1D0|nr:phosphate signaling complex protein PhoU [Rhodococcus sp. 14C212]NGP08531.1 phosphate signaling complex protein PhoU [Rhodococcus sp. 14C212]